MAGDGGQPEKSLMEQLAETPYLFDFFQVVRRIECMNPDLPRIGQSQRPQQDPIRFGQEPSLAFAPASLYSLKYSKQSNTPKLRVNFMGLLGPNGPMPLHITQYIRDRVHNQHDRTLANFFDLFHHRMISLLYRAWASAQPTVSRDRPDEDQHAMCLRSMVGLGFESLQNRDSVQDDAKLYFAGRLGLQTHNVEGLESIISGYFGIPTRIRQFVGQWVDLSSNYQCRLGESPDTGTLGSTAIMGSRYWDCQQKFRIIIGPLGLEDYERMLPSGRSFIRLRDWIRNYIGIHLTWELQLILKQKEVPRSQLGRQGRLGWTTWLSSGPAIKPSGDLVLQPSSA